MTPLFLRVVVFGKTPVGANCQDRLPRAMRPLAPYAEVREEEEAANALFAHGARSARGSTGRAAIVDEVALLDVRGFLRRGFPRKDRISMRVPPESCDDIALAASLAQSKLP